MRRKSKEEGDRNFGEENKELKKFGVGYRYGYVNREDYQVVGNFIHPY